MRCDEFKYWLYRKDLIEGPISEEARLHMVGCRRCKRLYDGDAMLEEAIRSGLSMMEVPAGLIEKIERSISSLDEEGREAGLWKRYMGRVLLPAVAMAMVAVLFVYSLTGPFHSVEEIGRLAVKNHLSELEMQFRAGEVEDIPRWFRGKLDYTVYMPDFQSLGLTLVGGRKCSLGTNEVAYLFYTDKTQRKISVFIIDSSDLGFDMKEGRTYSVTMDGYNVRIWKKEEVVFALVE